jgi:subfamily B ATP-binding cassette protein MsbA
MNQKVVFRMRTHLFEKLQRLQLTYHDQRQTGRLVSRVIDDVRTIERTFASMAIMIASDVGSLLIGVAVVLSISPKLSLIAFTVLPFYALVYWRLQKPFDENAKGIRRINASIYGLAADRLSSPRVVKAFHQERRESIRFFQKNKKMLRMRHRQILLGRYMWSGSAVISVVGTVLVIGFGAQMVRTRILTVGDFLLFHAAIATFFGPITNIASLAGEVVWLRVIIDRIVEILDEPVTILDHPDAKAMTAIKGDIRFEHATLKYAEGPRPAVSNLTVHVPAGAKVCLMGASGAGKTSMASLLLRLYEPAEGRITIDEVPIEQIKLSDLRRHIAYVPQEPILFSGTIAQNIRYGRADARDDQLVNAAKAAEIHEFIDQTPAGYETMVGERGVLLSGGQKQRISLARALLTDPKILILDDSTSALDAHTEARIQRTLHFALADRTAIMITHRASLSSKADLILVMENGKIVETGRHEELLANGGVYWSLISDQLSEEQRADFDFHVDARR